MIPYDPRDCGALCHRCPLGPDGPLRDSGAWRPVRGEGIDTRSAIGVVAHPAQTEEEAGHPLAGASGDEWAYLLQQTAYTRETFALTFAIACKPGGEASGAYGRMEARLKKLNRELEEGETPWLHPLTACKPRLWHDLQRHRYVLAMGGPPLKAITGIESIDKEMGFPVTVPETIDHRELLVMPIYSPSATMRRGRWRPRVLSAINKAVRWWNNGLQWSEPETVIRPTLRQLWDFLFGEWAGRPASEVERWTIDVETEWDKKAIPRPDMETARLQMVGICRSPGADGVRHVVVVPFLSVDGVTRFYNDEDTTYIVDCLRAAAQDGRVWVGHNWLYFDETVIERHFGFTYRNVHDTILGRRLQRPEGAKSLGVAGAEYTDALAWKEEKGEQSDHDRAIYNARDVAINDEVYAPIWEGARRRGQLDEMRTDIRPVEWPASRPWNLYEVDAHTMRLCRHMHRVGMPVNLDALADNEREKRAEMERWREACQEIAHRYDVHGPRAKGQLQPHNPGSLRQVAHLLYDKGGLIPYAYTDTGEPSTADASLRKHWIDPGVADDIRRYLEALRRFRRAQKALGTFIRPLGLQTIEGGYSMPAASDFVRRGPEWVGFGIIHPDWKAHGTMVGRLSAGGGADGVRYNPTNPPKWSRGVFQAPPGWVLIGADLDQAHLVLIANEWKIPAMVKTFVNGWDGHNVTAHGTFGDRFLNADGWREPTGDDLASWPALGPVPLDWYLKSGNKPKGQAGRMRQLAKILKYSGAYGAQPPVILETMQKEEDDDGNLVFADMDLYDVELIHEDWMRGEPEWEQTWAKYQTIYRSQGYLREPLFGRRFDFLDGPNLSEIVNAPILSMESVIMRIIEIRIWANLQRWIQSGEVMIINQMHDALYLLAREEVAEDVRKIVDAAFHVEIPGWRFPLTGGADIGKSMKEVG